MATIARTLAERGELRSLLDALWTHPDVDAGDAADLAVSLAVIARQRDLLTRAVHVVGGTAGGQSAVPRGTTHRVGWSVTAAMSS